MKNEDIQAESERLRDYYSQLSEEELIERGSQYETLTEAAQVAIRAEFDRRGLPAPVLADSADLKFQPLVTIRQFRDPSDAMLAKAALDSAGIFSFLRDENTVRVQWMWSNLMGGISLQVRPEDKAAAEEVLSQPIPDVFESDGVEYEQPRCPYCQSLDIDFESVNPKVGLASIIVAVPIRWRQNSWTCRDCGKKWKYGEDAEK